MIILMHLLKQNYVKYGLLLVLVMIVCLSLMEITGNNDSFDNKSPIFLVYQFIAPLVVWWLGIKAKKKELGGKLTFKQGVKEGFKMSLVFGVVSPFVFLLYYLLINPGIVEFVKTAYGLPNADNNMVIALDMFVQLVAAIIFGTLYSLLPSFFLKNKS